MGVLMGILVRILTNHTTFEHHKMVGPQSNVSLTLLAVSLLVSFLCMHACSERNLGLHPSIWRAPGPILPPAFKDKRHSSTTLRPPQH